MIVYAEVSGQLLSLPRERGVTAILIPDANLAGVHARTHSLQSLEVLAQRKDPGFDSLALSTQH